MALWAFLPQTCRPLIRDSSALREMDKTCVKSTRGSIHCGDAWEIRDQSNVPSKKKCKVRASYVFFFHKKQPNTSIKKNKEL